MKFPDFRYAAPQSVAEAVKLLAGSDNAKPIAGGQSLLPMMAFRLAAPSLPWTGFGTAFVERDGKIVEVRGMRLRASGRSKRNTRIDISEVRLATDSERETLHWFLFEDDRLVTWGRSEQWSAASRSHRVDVAYTPEPGPLPVQSNVKLVSGR